VRIAYVSDSFWPRINGVTIALQTYRDELARLGHDVLIICPEYPKAEGSGPSEAYVKRLASQSTPLSNEDRLVKPTALPSMFRALDKFKPDVIHINTEFGASLIGVLYSKLRGHPVLMTSHTDWEDYICNYVPHVNRRLLRATVRFLMRAVFGRADVLTTPSPSQAGRLAGYHIRKRLIIIPIGIAGLFSPGDPDEVAAYRRSLDARHPSIAGKRILLFAGRIADEKDPKFLLPVLAKVLEKRGDAVLVFAGDGPGRAGVEASARRRGLERDCVFLGYIDREELSLLYPASAVFVFPSKTETFGLCTIEAMSSGLPVVAVGEMGTRDVMQGDNGGFMVDSDVAAFSEAVIRLLDDDGLRRRKSEEAVAWSSRYASSAMIERMLRLYRIIAARRARVLRIRSGIR
jgi:glycosyltransferase involved in cell wall biosynthesis